MKLTHILKALGYFCLLFSDAFTEDSPEIIGPHRIQMRACPGKRLVLNCKAYANCEEDLTLIYWLVNGSFPETAYTNGRVAETEESTLDGGAILQRSLVLKNVTPEDLKSTFTCVVTNPAGTAHKYVTLKPARSKFRARRA